MRSIAVSVMLLAVLGCTAPDMPERRASAAEPLPAMRSFGSPNPLPVNRPNGNIAHDIMELGFFMESGQPIPVLSRFEGPITLRMAGQVPPTARHELPRLLERFRNEAGLRISRVSSDTPASINVEFVSRQAMRARVPQAACFIVPRVADWAEFRASRRSARLDWTTLVEREQVAVFIPHDTTPQEIRDCLHEEIAQALGPLNDLYRLTDSVFNDDNFQTTLTSFDMLVLRAWYAPELRSGMRPEEAAARLPAILARLNPSGERPPEPFPRRSPRPWIDAVETALSPDSSRSQRRGGARRAMQIAVDEAWQGPRLAFSLFLLARFSNESESELALASLLHAGRIYRNLPGGEAHAAHIEMQLAVQALGMGQFESVLELTASAIPIAARSENAALLATLMMMRSEALERTERQSEARSVRLDSLGWARYGFGADDAVHARAAEIAKLARISPGS